MPKEKMVFRLMLLGVEDPQVRFVRARSAAEAQSWYEERFVDGMPEGAQVSLFELPVEDIAAPRREG